MLVEYIVNVILTFLTIFGIGLYVSYRSLREKEVEEEPNRECILHDTDNGCYIYGVKYKEISELLRDKEDRPIRIVNGKEIIQIEELTLEDVEKNRLINLWRMRER